MRTRQQGFAAIEAIIAVAVLVLAIFLVWRALGGGNGPASPEQGSVSAYWSFDGTAWKSSGTPPTCPDPLKLRSPIHKDLATAVLYPGQTRGGNYKPHGGFLFASSTNNAVTVTAPMDGQLVLGSRYIEQGEVQYLLFFVNPCGIAYRFDHLLTLAPEMQKVADIFPEPQPNNSQTTMLATPVEVKAGDTIASAVGFKNMPNVSVDFGVYDLRAPNAASQNAAFAQKHQNEKEQAFYAVCWLNMIEEPAGNMFRQLPGGDMTAGKSSDYCK